MSLVFMNSISEGVLSKVIGSGDQLLLTDARCLPGSEGGAICIKNNNRSNNV